MLFEQSKEILSESSYINNDYNSQLQGLKRELDTLRSDEKRASEMLIKS